MKYLEILSISNCAISNPYPDVQHSFQERCIGNPDMLNPDHNNGAISYFELFHVFAKFR
jgi:hypothetical protein